MQQNAEPERLSVVKKILVVLLALIVALLPGAAGASRLAYSIYSPFEEHKVRTGIYTSRPDGTHPVRLIRGRHVFGAMWAPDRSHIAFIRTRYENRTPVSSRLDVVRSDGTRRVTVSQVDLDHETSRPFDWSPDSRKLTFVVDGDIYTATREGTERKRLTNTLRPEGDPAWSPDGTRIAFTGRTLTPVPPSPGTNEDIYVVDAAGGEPRQITTDADEDFQPRWSPDGSRLAFISTRGHCCTDEVYGSDIYVVDSDGSDEVRLTEDCTYKGSHQWLPDGSRLLFTSSADDDACPLPYRGPSMSVVDVTTSAVQELLPMRWFAWAAAVSRDGRWAAFSSYRSGEETVDLFRVRLRDGLVRRITNNRRKAHDVDPDW